MPGKRPNGTKTSSGKSKSDENTKKINDAEKQYDLDEELRKTKNGSIGKFSSLLDKHSRAQFANAAKNLMDGIISDVNGNGSNHHNNNIEKNICTTTSSTIGSRLDGEGGGVGGCNKRKRSSSIESSCSDESSELVVLSMVLNKKQKESDDVAMAIERLRENGVTCVYFSMDDIRKGTLKPGIPVSSKHRHSQKQQENNSLESKDKDKSSVHNNIIINVATTNGYSTFNGHHIKSKHQLLEVPVVTTTPPVTTLNHSTSPLRPFSPQPPSLSPQQHESMPILLVNNHHQPELKANFLKEIGLETKLLTENNSSIISTNETASEIVNEPTSTTKKLTKRKRRRKFVFSNNKKKRKTTTSVVVELAPATELDQPLIVLPTNVNVDKDLVIKKCTIDDINVSSAEFMPAKICKRTDRDNSDFWEVPPLSPSLLKSLDDPSLESEPQNDHQKASKDDSDHVKEKKIDLEDKPTPTSTSTVSEALPHPPAIVKRRKKKKGSTIKKKKKVDNNMTRALVTNSGSDRVVERGKKNKFIKIKSENIMPSLSTTLDVDDDKDTYSFKKEFSPDIISYKKVRQIRLEEKLANNNNKANTSSTNSSPNTTTTTSIPSKKKNNKKKCVQSISLDLDSKLKNVQKIIEITATTTTQIHPHNNNKDKDMSTFDFDDDDAGSTKGKIEDLSLPIAIPLEKVKANGPLRKLKKFKRKGVKVKRKILKVKNQDKKRNKSKSPIIVQEKVKESELGQKVKVSELQKSTAKTVEPFLVPISITPPSVNDTSSTPTDIYPRSEDSLPEANTDSMQLRRSSFYSLVSGNVRTNMENYLDGRPLNYKLPKRRKRPKNGFLLHHGDNCPEDPESPYRLHLATQILLKLNKRRAKVKPKEQNHKSFYSYFKLVAVKRSTRAGKNEVCTSATGPTEDEEEKVEEPLFSGEWTQPKKFICHLCGQVENSFWDMVTHKGEEHPGVVVTHMDLSSVPPHGLIRPAKSSGSDLPLPTSFKIPPCSKCSTTFDKLDELHRHIFECAGNMAWLEEKPVQQIVNIGGKKKKGKRRRGGGCYTFKRRLSNTPKKIISSASSTASSSPVKKLESTPLKQIPSISAEPMYKCDFCTRIFKTEFWLKNHKNLHSLPISIPLEKLSLPKLSRASNNSFSSSSLTAAILSLRSRESLKN